jgi:hypothetical protein
MIESGLVYIHYADSPTAFAGCGALVEGPFIVTCRHVWDEAVKATGDSRNVHIRFRPPGGEGEAKISPATLVDECTSLGGRPDLVILAAEIPAEITAYGLSRAKPQPTRGYAVAGLQRNGPGTTVRGITIWGELAGFIDEGLRQFTGEKDKGFFTDRGSSGSPVIIESTGELAGIVSLSEIGKSPGAASIHEAFAVPATTIHRHLMHVVGRETARANGFEESKIQQILAIVGADTITIPEIRNRLGSCFELFKSQTPPSDESASFRSATKMSGSSASSSKTKKASTQ